MQDLRLRKLPSAFCLSEVVKGLGTAATEQEGLEIGSAEHLAGLEWCRTSLLLFHLRI